MTLIWPFKATKGQNDYIPSDSRRIISYTSKVTKGQTDYTNRFAPYHFLYVFQWRRQDFFSSGANVEYACEQRSHGGAKRRVCAKRASRREAPRSRETRTEARSADRGAKRQVKSGEGFGQGARWAPPQENFWNFESATVQFGSFWKCNFTFINQLTGVACRVGNAHVPCYCAIHYKQKKNKMKTTNRTIMHCCLNDRFFWILQV